MQSVTQASIKPFYQKIVPPIQSGYLMIECRHFDSSLNHTRQQQCRFHSLSRCSRHHSHEPLCPACSRLSSPPSPTTIPTGTYQTFQSLCTAPPPTSASKTRSSRSSLAISACRPCARKPQEYGGQVTHVIGLHHQTFSGTLFRQLVRQVPLLDYRNQ